MLMSCWVFGRLKSWASYSVYDLVFIWVLVASYRILSVSSLKFAGPSWHCLAQSLVQKVGIGLCMRPAHQFAQQRAGLVPGTQHQKKVSLRIRQVVDVDKCIEIYTDPLAVCSSGWYRSHRENHDVCPRKVEKFTCQEISARKVEKFEKIEKSKSRKVEKKSKSSKNSKSRKLFGFLTFCENFPWKSDKLRGFWRHWSTGSIHAQGFLWLFGCSFPVEWLVTFQGSRKLAISVSELDLVLLM